MSETAFSAPQADLQSAQPDTPVWSRFDAEWYLSSYPEVVEAMAELGIGDVETYYREHGAKLLHSPNRYFDEKYYMGMNRDVADAVANGLVPSGFVHYCNDGYRESIRPPHWLFDERYYLKYNRDLNQRVIAQSGAKNGYDHYLRIGDAEHRNGHWFFDGAVYLLNSTQSLLRPDRGGAFMQYLHDDTETGANARVSWYFDPDWYQQTYPEVRELVASGAYLSPLHHYLCNPTPQAYLPCAWFSEEYYAATYPDVQVAVDNGVFRNNYEHFIRHGAAERRAPAQGIDLLKYYLGGSVRIDLEGGAFRDAFAHWIARRPPGGHGSDKVAVPDEKQTKHLFAVAADNLLPQLAHTTLDFTLRGPAEISVIVVLFNKFPLTMLALASLRSNYPGNIELIIVDNKSYDDTRHLERYVRGAHIIHNRYNAGFVEACNRALDFVTGPAVLYLNNDLQIGLNAVALSLRRLFSEPNIGAVGTKLIRTNGMLQEGGSIIWRDGSTFGYLRDADPNIPEANFVRDVDFCSGAFLLVRTELVRQLGGFDVDYKPAYYEEADMCVRLRKAGYRIVYDPALVVQHFEYGSASSAASTRLMLRNHGIFQRKHRDWLRYQHPPRARNALFARTARNGQKRILLIEDRVPLRHLGAGYVRSNDIVRTMASLGHLVTVFPIYKSPTTFINIYRDFPDTVEVIYDRDQDDLPDFIESRAGYYDVVWVGRTHNLERLLGVLSDNSTALPAHGFVLDTEAIAAPRSAERDRVLGIASKEPMETALRRELDCAYFCQKIIAVNERDATLIRRVGFDNVAVLGHMKEPQATFSPFSARRDMLFLGALHDPGSPNHDSLEWFVEHVLPLVDGRLPPDVRFNVAGFINPSVDLSPLTANPRVNLIGPVDDLEALYDAHRIFVAPTRFAGGIPFKVHEASSYGLPIVATQLLCSQVGWSDRVEIMSGGTDNPAQFADRIVELYTDRERWISVRHNALVRLERENSRAEYRHALGAIINDVISHVALDVPAN
ncbi:GT2 family glycosyltransferase [Endobacter medicaginis]|uniref:Glycosyltransferase n=1 Tax=Endobacter medicaginis TaxID=1181271 RepID=A0A850NTD5_9PROT|nr:glycosyltransferase [Endobacter medicaginis]MBB3174724.1 GT2 family glycosyltransferase [Endobacter medicaginis]MCX5474881.1 glycosyltransferase [Endobacter medicaginis]NVN30672.1 glycosyltransferase [Endobacter medicaginis]